MELEQVYLFLSVPGMTGLPGTEMIDQTGITDCAHRKIELVGIILAIWSKFPA
jgi:hypothetical protein